jgi:hypothetical protein
MQDYLRGLVLITQKYQMSRNLSTLPKEEVEQIDYLLAIITFKISEQIHMSLQTSVNWDVWFQADVKISCLCLAILSLPD